MRLEYEEVYQGNDIQKIKKVIKTTIQKALIEPLFASIKHNNLKAVQELIKAGADVNSSDTFEGSALKRSALNYAVTNSTIEMVELLLSYNANLNQDGNRNKVLASAIKQGDESKVKALIKAKIG